MRNSMVDISLGRFVLHSVVTLFQQKHRGLHFLAQLLYNENAVVVIHYVYMPNNLISFSLKIYSPFFCVCISWAFIASAKCNQQSLTHSFNLVRSLSLSLYICAFFLFFTLSFSYPVLCLLSFFSHRVHNYLP